MKTFPGESKIALVAVGLPTKPVRENTPWRRDANDSIGYEGRTFQMAIGSLFDAG